MRSYACIFVAATTVASVSSGAHATPPISDAEIAYVTAPTLLPRYLLDDGRMPHNVPHDGVVSFTMRGEYQLRLRANAPLPLIAPVGQAAGSELGQQYYLYHWLRLRPQLQYGKLWRLVGEIDLPRGMVAGQNTHLVDAARDNLAETRFWDVHPRQLFFEYQAPIGMFRLGQQTSHWGMGLLADDGDHPTLFGDYRRGNLVERLLFATKPLGADHPLGLALAGDVVFEDEAADLIDGDVALQAVAALRWEAPMWEVGVYGVIRHQYTEHQAALTRYRDELTIGVLDVTGKFQTPMPGQPDDYLFGQAELAFVVGSTSYLRTANQLDNGEREDIRSFGASAHLGAVHTAEDSGGRYGKMVAQLAWGYASGDADPFDGVSRRFTFHQNHNAGLVLFDHVMAWRTARSATLAGAPGLVNRPDAGLRFLPSEGGIFGATYLNPTAVFRPVREVDLKAGLLLATTTADFVDPYEAGALGDYRNFDGGDAGGHNLGVEVDLGIDSRIDLSDFTRLQLGAEAGVLFPGNAFEDGDGGGLDPQWLLNTKLGFQL